VPLRIPSVADLHAALVLRRLIADDVDDGPESVFVMCGPTAAGSGRTSFAAEHPGQFSFRGHLRVRSNRR
jgi:hypothetical protein